MRKRTKAREWALKMLYMLEITKDDIDTSVKQFWEANEEVEEVRQFAERLVKGTREKSEFIDDTISRSATNWQLKRMAVVDRNILRFATYELLFMSDIPPKVTINEAVDIAKKYGDEDSGKFVNGILDTISKESEKTKK